MKAFVAGAVVAAAASLLGAVSYAAETSNQSPMLIGLIAGTTGAYGSTGIAIVNGAQLAVDKINAAGGVLGRQQKLDANNDDASATLSGQLSQNWWRRRGRHGGFPDTVQVTAELAMGEEIPTMAWSMTAVFTFIQRARRAIPIPGSSILG